jgi:hypothetical protein
VSLDFCAISESESNVVPFQFICVNTHALSRTCFFFPCLIHHIYIAESAFATTIAATDADDVAIMSIESEGNFNQAMVNMLRGRVTAGVVSLRNNKDSFNEVEASQAKCKGYGNPCMSYVECCEYK